MFEKEEQNLIGWKKVYDELQYPVEDIDAAIQAGFQKGRQHKKKVWRKRWLYSTAAAAVFFITFFVSIRYSTVLANYIAVIPGMEKVVEMIRYDKGLLAAVENDYVQEIGVSQERNGLKVNIDHVIADEYGMVLFYYIESNEKQTNFQVHDLELKSAKGKDPVMATSGYGVDFPNDTPRNKVDTTAELFFSEPLETTDFILDIEVGTGTQKEHFEIPFTLNKSLEQKRTYEVNKTLSIEQQNITIKQVEIYPLRVAVTLEMDESNSKKILSFDDLRLVDEHGEAWTKISNGVTANYINENEQILYLQSNYFKEPEELYIVLNRLQAIDREDDTVVVDTSTEEILKQPKGELLSDLEVIGNDVWFKLKTEREFNYSLFMLSSKDAKGNEYNHGSMVEGHIVNGMQRMGIRLNSTNNSTNIANPLTLEISAYPLWIRGDAKVKVK
ncbi:DUF4179 domain-containing protein [Cytobacillus gottheilii]|uniref:DUF4179 domain-containing protein n=1 Tax=Cytobacillus gottheilii TaxID=859144 RepID=UPI0024953C44|nr:DUF4179 domain-containing protein [Cytobacillus gottheilii]